MAQAAASEVYFGKKLKEVSVAEAAMLAGLPKAPSAYNPINNPRRATIRQQYILERMYETGYLTEEQRDAAKAGAGGSEESHRGFRIGKIKGQAAAV